MLKILEMPLHKYSNRASLTQTLEPIEQGQPRRTVNGELRFLAIPERRKYRTSISGSDLNTAVLDGQVIGRTVTIECGSELAAYIPAGATSVTLERDVAAGSVRLLTAAGDVVSDTIWTQSGRTITLNTAQGSDIHVYYRPVLTCLILDFSSEEDLNGARSSWSLVAEEV